MLTEDQLEDAEAAGDIGKVFGALSAADDELMAEAALDALLRLTAGRGEGVEGERASVDTAGTEVIMSSITKYMGEAPVVEVGLGCLKNMLGALSSAHSDDVSVSAGRLIVTAMKTHKDEGEPTLIEQACLAAKALAYSKAACTAMIEAGIEALLEEAPDLIDNERNKKYPPEAMAAIKEAIA